MKNIVAALAVITGLLVLSAPAQAAFSVTHKGSNQVGTGTTVSVTGLTIANGDLILVGGAVRLAANADVLTVSDTAGDTFTYYEHQTGGTSSIRTFVAFAKTTGLSSGSVTLTTSGGSVLVMALSVEDVTGFDSVTTEDTTARATAALTNAVPSITSGTPTYSADLFYSSFQVGNVTYTEDATWTNTVNNLGNTNSKATTAYFVGSGTTAATRTGSTSGSGNWRGVVIGIKASGAAAPTFHGLSSIGAGK